MKMIETNRIYNEPCLETVARMPDNYLDCVITSPPYWQLRDYGYDGQWGLEPTYQQYLEHLWSLMDAIYPKLKDGGTVWVNLGDTYNTKSGNMVQKEYSNTINTCMNNGVIDKDVYTKAKDVKNKTLLLIPHRFAIGCIDRGWIMRNDIIWAKRNGMPESVTDRFSKKHEYFFFMVKNEKYHFDLDSIRDKVIVPANGRSFGNNQSNGKKIRGEWKPKNQDLGKNPGSVSDFWDIPTKPSKIEHYASYNDSLLVKPVLAGCPKGGVIYDPFMGTGSTAEVAIRAGRNFIGSEMSEDYCDIAEKRIQPYLTQQTFNFD